MDRELEALVAPSRGMAGCCLPPNDLTDESKVMDFRLCRGLAGASGSGSEVSASASTSVSTGTAQAETS